MTCGMVGAPPAQAAVSLPGWASVGWDGPLCPVPLIIDNLGCNKKVYVYASSRAGTTKVDQIRVELHLHPFVSTNRIKVAIERTDQNNQNAGSGTFEVAPRRAGWGGRKWSSSLRPPKTGRDVPGLLCITVYEAMTPGRTASDFSAKGKACVKIYP